VPAAGHEKRSIISFGSVKAFGRTTGHTGPTAAPLPPNDEEDFNQREIDAPSRRLHRSGDQTPHDNAGADRHRTLPTTPEEPSSGTN
jgi:hypothetical protein